MVAPNLDYAGTLMTETHGTGASEMLLRMAFDTGEGFKFVRDVDGRIALSNRAYAAFFGLEPAEIEGRLQSEVYASLGWNQPMIDKWLEEDRQVIQSQIPTCIEEHVVHKDGSESCYRTRKFPLTLPDGRKGVLVSSERIERSN